MVCTNTILGTAAFNQLILNETLRNNEVVGKAHAKNGDISKCYLSVRCSNNNISPSRYNFMLGTVLLTRYGKVGCIYKYPIMVWTHQLSCCESSILLSVINSYLSVEF
jgi:hypothetical protein